MRRGTGWRGAAVLALLAGGVCGPGALAGSTYNIMLTGYWPPTNEMVREFSTNPAQNPGGWKGGNFHGRGYNVYSFFPEFPGGTGVNSKGEGDLEVDYQDTDADWARITDQVKPCAIITFSWTQGNIFKGGKDWEIENRNRNRSTWTDDYQAPFKPDKMPPDDSIAANAWRYSTLPEEKIKTAVNGLGLGLDAFIDNNGGGSFLSEYIGYHGVWYQNAHSSASDPYQCFAAGHIHVGSKVTVEQGRMATEITVDQLMDYLDTVVPGPGPVVALGAGMVWSAVRRKR